ncbi:MAG: MFS transporter [Ktedonobacterales bacterium]
MDTTTISPAASSGSPTESSRKPGFFINRNFGLLLSGQGISIIGDMVFNTTLVIWIGLQLAKGYSWAPLAVSGVLLAAAVPAFLIGPFAGVFVDRTDKRRMMLWMDGFRAVIVAALILVSGAFALPFLPGGQLPLFWQLGVIYGVVVLVNTAEQFFRPAMMALIADIVNEADQPRAMGLAQVSVSLGLIIGPTLAAPLFVVFGPQWALLVNALSFVASYVTLLAMRPPKAATSVHDGQRPSFAREFFEGLRFYLHSRVLMTLLIAVVVAVLGAGALNTLDVFFTTGNLHASTGLYGLMNGVFGFGAIAGAILASIFAQRLGVVRLLCGGILAIGVLVIVMAPMTSFWPALVIFGLVGVAQSAMNTAAGPLMMRATPREFMGRVNSVFNPMMNLAILISSALVGYLAGVTLHDFHAAAFGLAFGAVDTIYLGAGVLIILGGVVAVVGLRGIEKNTPSAETIQDVATPLGVTPDMTPPELTPVVPLAPADVAAIPGIVNSRSE